jgi:ethanolamine ammonia-lyase small subunit
VNGLLDEKLINRIAEEVMRQLKEKGFVILPDGEQTPAPAQMDTEQTDITSAEVKAKPLLKDACDNESLLRMKKTTNARIGVGKSGPRLNTQTMLAMRADHAKARDSVFADVDEQLIERLGLMTVQSKCDCKDTYMTRPDLGRKLNDQSAEALRRSCTPNPDVQIFASDGLSSAAIEANLERILPIEPLPFTASSAKLYSKMSFFSLGRGLRKILRISASPLGLAENHTRVESGLPWVTSYHLSLVTPVTANLLA